MVRVLGVDTARESSTSGFDTADTARTHGVWGFCVVDIHTASILPVYVLAACRTLVLFICSYCKHSRILPVYSAYEIPVYSQYIYWRCVGR